MIILAFNNSFQVETKYIFMNIFTSCYTHTHIYIYIYIYIYVSVTRGKNDLLLEKYILKYLFNKYK